jgi:hypothetical protein
VKAVDDRLATRISCWCFRQPKGLGLTRSTGPERGMRETPLHVDLGPGSSGDGW